MDVGGDRATEREMIRAGLFLGDGPKPRRAVLKFLELLEKARPGGAGFAADGAGEWIEFEHAIKRGHVEQKTVLEELLAAHGVASASDAEVKFAGGSGLDEFGELDEGRGAKKAFDGGGVELGMAIVKDHAIFSNRGCGLVLICRTHEGENKSVQERALIESSENEHRLNRLKRHFHFGVVGRIAEVNQSESCVRTI